MSSAATDKCNQVGQCDKNAQQCAADGIIEKQRQYSELLEESVRLRSSINERALGQLSPQREQELDEQHDGRPDQSKKSQFDSAILQPEQVSELELKQHTLKSEIEKISKQIYIHPQLDDTEEQALNKLDDMKQQQKELRKQIAQQKCYLTQLKGQQLVAQRHQQVTFCSTLLLSVLGTFVLILVGIKL